MEKRNGRKLDRQFYPGQAYPYTQKKKLHPITKY